MPNLLSVHTAKRLALTLLLLLCTRTIQAQEQLLPDSPQPTTIEARVTEETTLKNDRLFYVMANYNTVETQDTYGTLSPKTKFLLSVKTMTDPVTVSFIGAVALIGQAHNTDPSYGQGMEGYSKRFATSYANTAIGTVMTSSVFPTVLHQDPRYFQLGTGSKLHRTLYSVSRIFVTRSDKGEPQFNYSEVVGNGVAAGISNAYLPQSQRTVGNTMTTWGTNIVLNTICNVAKEFWPDIRRNLHNRRQ